MSFLSVAYYLAGGIAMHHRRANSRKVCGSSELPVKASLSVK